MKINFDKDWKFYLGDLSPKSETDGWGGAKAKAYSFGAVNSDLDDSRWRSLDLPHDFVAEGDYTRNKIENNDMKQIPEMDSIDSRHFAGGSLEGGVAWYRKHFDISDSAENKRVYLHFDGIYRNSTVYLNEYFVGSHKSGYTGFCFDITDFVNIGGENVLAVRVDATGREGWWYEGGGIYRHVWLEYKENTHIANDGVYVHYDIADDMRSANVHIETELLNKALEDKNVNIKSIISDKNGNAVGETANELNINAWDSGICRQNINMSDIQLWDIDNPYLYSLKTEIYAEGTLIDEQITSFGVRECRFDADNGFFLNGKSVKVKGLCCHHDHAGVGIGVPDSVQEYRIAQMKSMGANGYRCAHYPPTKELLDICDRMGILVMDETRRMSSAAEDLESLRAMVKRDRNHPSVFIWCIGNEEIFSQDKPETARTTVTMKMEVQKLDKTRPITSAVVCWNGKERFNNAANYVNITKNLDVMGFNYCTTAWDDYHERQPKQPIIITEASSNSGTRGCYSTDEAKGQYYVLDPDNYDKCENKRKAIKKDMGEEEWKYFAERDYLAGIFLWTGIDYRGEPTPLTYPAVYSQFGIFDYCCFPKDNFYYYKSWWTDEPTLHVFPHWNFPDKEGEPLEVHCYSNLDEVEIFVNGKSYGKKAMESNRYLSWENVIYESGELKAIGYKDGKEIMTDIVRTTGAPHKLELVPYKAVSYNDAVIVNVRAVDADGAVVPTADNEVRFTVEGAGVLLGTGNGNPASHENEKLPVRRLFNGWAQLVIKPIGKGIVTVKAESNGIQRDKCEINIQ